MFSEKEHLKNVEIAAKYNGKIIPHEIDPCALYTWSSDIHRGDQKNIGNLVLSLKV